MKRLGRSTKLSNKHLKRYALMLGFCFDSDTCAEIRKTSFDGETISSAVRDYLNAYECPVPWKGFSK